jgi:hypothetical protein
MGKKLFRDKRTGEIKTQFSVLEARFMEELKPEHVINNTENEIKKMLKNEKAFRKLKGFN